MMLLFALGAKAQDAVSISPVVGLDAGVPLFINRTQGVLNPLSGSIANFTTLSESYAVGAQLIIPNVLAKDIALIGRAEGIYSTCHFNFGSPAYSVSGIDRKILFEIAAEWGIQAFSIHVGPWVSESISRNIYENDPVGNRIASGDTIASSATHVGLSAGIAWNIPNFPIHPELHAALDLTELPAAGANAFFGGISLIYNFGGGKESMPPPADSISSSATPTQILSNPTAPPVVPRVRFLVNGSETNGNPPLERVETHIKRYAMVDAPYASPRVTQWVEESYHLPHLALSCRLDRHADGYLMILKDSLRLMEKYFEGNSKAEITPDTVVDLETDSAWNNVLSHLNTGESNRLVAELRTNRAKLSLSSDTLVLPAVDTSQPVRTMVRRQFRFDLSDKYSTVAGGKESLGLLLGRIKTLLDSNATMEIREPSHITFSALYSELKRRLNATFGYAWSAARRGVRREVGSEKPDEIEMVLEY